jgi:hypothetical protein
MRWANDVGNLAIGGLEMHPATTSASVTLLPTGGPHGTILPPLISASDSRR